MPVTTANPLATLFDALAFAAHKHRDQRRKDADATPYINHPIALARILSVEGGIVDPVVLTAAILHDTIEDTETTADELCADFGSEVTGVVLEVTDDTALPKVDRKRLQVEHAPHISQSAKLVKLADKIANLRDIKASPPANWSMQRRREYADWTRLVIDGLRGVHAGLETSFDQAHASVCQE